jgi:hypothetical protein
LHYYYGKKKAREPVAHAHAITSGHMTSGDVTSGSSASNVALAVLKYYLRSLAKLYFLTYEYEINRHSYITDPLNV